MSTIVLKEQPGTILRDAVRIEQVKVGVQGPAGPPGSQGQQGPQGPQGIPGTEQFLQVSFTAATTVTLNHNFNRRPTIIAFDSSGNEFIAEISHTDANTSILNWNIPQTGFAIAN